MVRATAPEATFSAELHAVLAAARDIARETQANDTTPDHLACALLMPSGLEGVTGPTIAGRLLDHLDFDANALHRTLLEAFAVEGVIAKRARPSYGSASTLVIAQAGVLALNEAPDTEVGTAHLLLALVASVERGDVGPCVLVDRLAAGDVGFAELLAKWNQMRKSNATGRAVSSASLDERVGTGPDFVSDLTARARAGLLDPIIGRDEEIGRVIRVLSRRTKNNPALLGEPGVGKTAIAEGLAQWIVAGNVPERLLGKRVLSLSTGAVVAGTKYRGDFEGRILPFLRSVAADSDIILFIDELHTIVGAGTGGVNESGNLSNLMKPMLARGELRCMGATTLADYRQYIEGDEALERRFAPVDVREPSEPQTLAILAGLAPRYGNFHGVTYPEAVLEACVALPSRHLPDRHFPDKAIDVMDEAGTRASLDGRLDVSVEDALAAVAGMASTTIEALAADPVAGSLAARMATRVIGQDTALATVATIVESRRMGLTERKAPLASFVLVGPTGCGKTTMAETLASADFDGEITTINLANYADKTSITGLIGAPPSYVGFDEPSRLVEPLRRRSSRVVLLQHADAAAPEVRALIAQVLRDGALADTHDRTASFRDAVVILTVTEQAGSGSPIGFRAAGTDIASAAERRMRDLLGADLVDLLDAVVPLSALDEMALEAIATAQLTEIRSSLSRRMAVDLTMSPSVSRAVVARVGHSQGARPIRRAVEHLVEHPLASALGRPSRRPGRYTLDMESGLAVVRREPETTETVA